jgi:hypothetical protein
MGTFPKIASISASHPFIFSANGVSAIKGPIVMRRKSCDAGYFF